MISTDDITTRVKDPINGEVRVVCTYSIVREVFITQKQAADTDGFLKGVIHGLKTKILQDIYAPAE